MKNEMYDLIVIGGGPAGYAGAIRAGQLGKRVLCIEAERAGGTCLNWGCIPSKALLKSAEMYQGMLHAEEFGLHVSDVKADFEKVMQRSRKVADNMGGGIEFLFKKNKVDYIVGYGQLSAPGTVEVVGGREKGKRFSAKNVLLATGCKARMLPGLEIDPKRVMTSREALAMTEMPRSIAILGAGAIGAEFAYFLNAMGCDVTLIEMMDRILPIEDEESSKAVTRAFKKQGIKIHVGTLAEDIQNEGSSVTLNLNKEGKKEKLEVDSLLVAVGVVPNTKGIVSDEVNLGLDEKGYIKVGDRYETNIKGVYAAGDVIGAPWLAHVATFEALQAVNGMVGKGTPKRLTLYPGCTYCQPQVASVGLTEKAAKEKELKYKVGKFPFTASGKAVAVNHPEGFVKVIVDEEFGEILGAHIVGVDATELIAEYCLAMNVEATADDIHHTIHAHPTMSEALMEAAADTLGEAVHI